MWSRSETFFAALTSMAILPSKMRSTANFEVDRQYCSVIRFFWYDSQDLNSLQIKFYRLNSFPFLGTGPRSQLIAEKRFLKNLIIVADRVGRKLGVTCNAGVVGEISDQGLRLDLSLR